MADSTKFLTGKLENLLRRLVRSLTASSAWQSGVLPDYIFCNSGGFNEATRFGGVALILQFRSHHIKRFRTTPAMAAKVTERLWEVSDIVEVLETRDCGEWVATRPNVV
jgi:hypothetical protein